MRLLVCDDDESVRRFVQALFVSDGWYVATVSSGEACLALLDAYRAPDVLVLDQIMPGMTGLETLRRARALGYTRPVVLFSAHLEPDLQREAEDLGALAVSKIDIPALVRIVNSVLR